MILFALSCPSSVTLVSLATAEMRKDAKVNFEVDGHGEKEVHF